MSGFGLRLELFSVNSDAGLVPDVPKPPLAFFLGAEPLWPRLEFSFLLLPSRAYAHAEEDEATA